MLGAIIGDIVGSRFEFDNIKHKDFELFDKRCMITDDGIMSLAVAKALMETEKVVQWDDTQDRSNLRYAELLKENAIIHMQKIGRRYPHCGYGGMFIRWVFSDDPQPYNSFGNGAAMRISAVGFVSKTMEEAIEKSRIITAVSHDHIEGIKGAEATVVAIMMARKGFSQAEIKEKISNEYYNLDFTIDEIRDTYHFNETSQDTVPQAIQCFLEATSFEDAIRIAISLGGDSDTIAAITGPIAEAYYGVPKSIKSKALMYLDDDLREIYDQWEIFIGNSTDSHVAHITLERKVL